MSTILVVQARMTSTRLPGKVLLPIFGRPMLAFQMERLERVASRPRLVIATTTNETDDVIVRFCKERGYDCIRGSESDVLSRHCAAIETFNADNVIRITSDCPLLDPSVVDRVWNEFANGGCDYASNMLRVTYPYGMAVEAVTAQALLDAHREAKAPAEREHVTPYIYWRPERFALRSVELDRDLSFHRWTVDTPQDFELVSRIVSALYPAHPQFTMWDALALLEQHPDWLELNRDVAQKSVTKE